MPFSHKRIFLIPLDNRPVCYDMPRRLAASAGLELCMPTSNLLGQMKAPANFKALSRWFKNHLFENDPVIVALDTVAYGGLIPSRVNEEPYEALKKRVDTFFEQIRTDACYGFSSILRIPNYNFDEEEPEYWNQYGKTLYQYSSEQHQTGQADTSRIPSDILKDFSDRREKNYTLNEYYLALLANGRLDYLTYCQDDTGAYGLNVQEAQSIQALLKKRNLNESGHIQTGADEVATCMLARWMVLQSKKPLKVYADYSSDQGKNIVAKFDGLPIHTVVEKAIVACGATPVKRSNDADLIMLVHTPQTRQGDHCEKQKAIVEPKQIETLINKLNKAIEQQKPVTIADVAYTNGGDPRLAEHLLSQFEDLRGLYGYAGWNTPGNTIGTAVAMGLIRLMAENNKSFKPEAFAQLMLIRLADDWLYQADVRYKVRQSMNGTAKTAAPDEMLLNVLMADGIGLLKTRFGLEQKKIHCSYPCNRTFEVEVGIQ